MVHKPSPQSPTLSFRVSEVPFPWELTGHCCLTELAVLARKLSSTRLLCKTTIPINSLLNKIAEIREISNKENLKQFNTIIDNLNHEIL